MGGAAEINNKLVKAATKIAHNKGMEVAINNEDISNIIEDFKMLQVTYEANTKCKDNDNGCITKNSNALRDLYKSNHGNAVIQLLTHLIENLEKPIPSSKIPSSKIPSYEILNIELQQTFKRIKSHLDNIKNPPLEAVYKGLPSNNQQSRWIYPPISF